MRDVFKILPEDAADFTAVNLKARAIVSAGAFGAQTAVSADKLRVRAAILASSILAATLVLAMPAGATEAGEEAAKHAAPDKICLQKASYKTEGGAVRRYEYEVSQNYDAKARRLEKTTKKAAKRERPYRKALANLTKAASARLKMSNTTGTRIQTNFAKRR